MSVIAELIRALSAAGSTPEQIAVAVEVIERQNLAKEEERKAKGRERVRKHREQKRNVTLVTLPDVTDVTKRYDDFPPDPPSKPPTPLNTPPYTPPISEADASDKNPIDYDKMLFDEGKKIAAGSMVSKLKKICGGDPVRALEIVRVAAGRSDPLAYLSATMRNEEQRNDKGRRHFDAIDEAARAASEYFDRVGVPRIRAV